MSRRAKPDSLIGADNPTSIAMKLLRHERGSMEELRMNCSNRKFIFRSAPARQRLDPAGVGEELLVAR